VLPGVIREAGRRYGDLPAFETAALWTVSYAELDRLTDEAAAGLARRGVREGQYVALLLPSTVDYMVAYGAVAKLGAITAGVNPRHTAAERARVLDASEPDWVLAVPDMADGVGDRRVLEVVPADHPDGILAGLRDRGEAPPVLPDDDERAVCICFTSGSTGDPKGAVFLERQLRAIAQLDSNGSWGTGGHTIAATAFAHVGFATKIPWQLAAGGTFHLQDRWSAGRTLELLGTHRIAVVNGVPPQLALMLRHPTFDDYDWSHVTAIVAGAAASPPALVDEARRRWGAPYAIRYSSTESGGVGLGTALDGDDDETLHSVGRPRPGVEAKVCDDDGREVPTGELGQLWTRSAAQMAGYWRNPTATAEALHDGWLRTGDLAIHDERGLFRLAGRAKEMFIRGGYNVYPMEVEGALGTHPQVAQVVVVPRPDPVMGEIGVAVVVPLDPADPPSLESLREHGRQSLSAYKLPEAITFVEEIPLAANSKIDRRTLTEQVADPNG
jgi:acyl-CoA synthetase (AMP-forming)/AMP-acid ligase II